MLSVLGYSSISASNGAEAFNIYLKDPSNIDGVILDLVMPVMGGEEAFKRFHQHNPALPIIITTGYSQDKRLQHLNDVGIKNMLLKPFKIGQLEAMLKQIFSY